MRLSSRLSLLIILQLVAVLYFGSVYLYGWRSPLEIPSQIRDKWSAGPLHRIVVFGDGWSDTGEYRVSPPPKGYSQDRDEQRGELWTEVLCKELVCDRIDNFARAQPLNLSVPMVGPLVDTQIHENTTTKIQYGTVALFDFQAQVQQFLQFLQFDRKRSVIPGLGPKENRTTFTVFFGIADIWEYAACDMSTATHAIDRSIEELFHNLDLLAEHEGGLVTVVIPQVPDLTFLPRFQDMTSETHKYVHLSTYWNTILSQAAIQWRHGRIFMPEVNKIVVDQVRAHQLHAKQVSDGSGLGKQTPLFDDVEKPCRTMRAASWEGEAPHAAGGEKCPEPARHLFWDGMHLSGPAHKLIGEDAARLVRANSTVNSDEAREAEKSKAAATHKTDDSKTKMHAKAGKDDLIGSELRFPPGY